MTIIQDALIILSKTDRSMSAEEIYNEISKAKLFVFNTKEPIAILKAQLRKNCIDFKGKNSIKNPSLKQLGDKKFTRL